MREAGFELELEVSATDAGYRIAARSGVGGECVADTSLAPEGLLLEQRLQSLRYALLSSAATTRRVPSRDEEAVQRLGKELFGMLFVGDVRALFDTTRQQAAQQDQPVRLVLRIRSADLAALPWEFLYDARRDDYLSLSMPLVRYPEILETVRPLRVAPPLRILGMSARPAGLDQLDVAAEKGRLQRALSRLAKDRRVELTWVSGETWRDLLHALNNGQWHVLHVIAHGGFDTVAGEGVIYLPGADGSTYPLRASRLAQVVNLHSSLRLVLLNSCESGLASTTDLFSSSAATLIRRGVPAVLAMQFEISDDAAIEFTSSFYEGVASGQPIDIAVRNARLELSLARPNSLEWGTPVLYLRQSDGQIFDVTPAETPQRSGPPTESAIPKPSAIPRQSAIPKQTTTPRKSPAPERSPAPEQRQDAERAEARKWAEVPREAGATRRLREPLIRPPEHEAVQPPRPHRTAPPPPSPPATPRTGERRRPAGSRRRVVVIAAAVACAAVLTLLILMTALGGGGTARSAVIRVEADQSWTDSGMRLKAGQQYRIEATGEVSSESGAHSGPDGDAGRRDDPVARVRQANFGALLGRIGDRSMPFVVGSGVSGRAATAGELSLGVNDANTDDNTGSFTVTISLVD